MAFSTQNSGRRIVQDKPNWKSRSLSLGNRHRTTMNFGDLVPAYWQFVQPGDKLKMDCSILAKFMPLLAPAFSRMKLKTEWFYVPLRQISPVSLAALQNFNPLESESNDALFEKISNVFNYDYSSYQGSESKTDQQIPVICGFPSIRACDIAQYLQGETVTRLNDVNRTIVSSAQVPARWREILGSGDSVDNLGFENLTSFNAKNRVAKLCGYMGLPKRLSTTAFISDVALAGNVDDDDVLLSDGSSYSVISSRSTLDKIKGLLSADYLFMTGRNPSHLLGANVPIMVTTWDSLMSSALSVSVEMTNVSASLPYVDAVNRAFLHIVPSPSVTIDIDAEEYGLGAGVPLPWLTTYDTTPISLLPFQAYQKIFNDFYRDEKLQPEEIRTYPLSYLSDVNGVAVTYNSSTNGLNASATPIVDWNGSQRFTNAVAVYINNLMQLRRRNREKDVLSSALTDKVITKYRNGVTDYSGVYTTNLFGKLAKFFMKHEFTGNTWAEWLSNFFGEKSNDFLNNNVIFLGGRDSVVSISENIQNSSSTDESPQGNRAGLAGDFHNGNSLYFRVPDFGVIMCIVSAIPDDVDNFNGLPERFCKWSPLHFNLPDLQNVGFTAVPYRRSNLGIFDFVNTELNYNSSATFGYQPFGYDSTYTPDVISGDFRGSLRYWHQSPDLDVDFANLSESANIPPSVYFTSWEKSQPKLNLNYPSIGMRFTPQSNVLSAQYYNNLFAVTNDESGDHILCDMRFDVTCHRQTAFFTDAIDEEK